MTSDHEVRPPEKRGGREGSASGLLSIGPSNSGSYSGVIFITQASVNYMEQSNIVEQPIGPGGRMEKGRTFGVDSSKMCIEPSIGDLAEQDLGGTSG
ncbi:hypothetical protein Dsin_028979 [Dipteronia sinensis]|uniref:Uncharacterized protein n=1 Tax=Dipteronia sinensis TaxID=43782 RepID=A0AAD9ZRG7_9ROSI|nr:hypothetical protein Dsin_028979 [Dipteronia sinensis]